MSTRRWRSAQQARNPTQAQTKAYISFSAARCNCSYAATILCSNHLTDTGCEFQRARLVMFTLSQTLQRSAVNRLQVILHFRLNINQCNAFHKQRRHISLSQALLYTPAQHEVQLSDSQLRGTGLHGYGQRVSNTTGGAVEQWRFHINNNYAINTVGIAATGRAAGCHSTCYA